jgi:hypothetical protein
MAVQGHSATTRTAAAGRRSAPRFTAMLLVVALLASACGSTAYRDRVDLLAQAGEQAQDPVTGEATTESPDVPAPDATDAATEGTDPGEGDPVVAQPGAPSATEGQSGNGTTGGTTGGGTGGTTDGQQPPPTTQPPSSNLPQTSDNGRGVTNDTVRVGVIALSSFQNLGSNLGFTVADKGDIRAQIRDLAAWINSNGGVAGRNIEPIIRIYTQEEASPGAEAQICNAFADDDQVFAVMLYGQIHESTRECYASKRVLMIDPTPFVFDEVLYQQLSPYLWSTSYPNYSRVARTLPHALAGTDFFQPHGQPQRVRRQGRRPALGHPVRTAGPAARPGSRPGGCRPAGRQQLWGQRFQHRDHPERPVQRHHAFPPGWREPGDVHRRIAAGTVLLLHRGEQQLPAPLRHHQPGQPAAQCQ